MTIDHDTQLLIIGAVIGLFSSLITAYFQDWLSRRAEMKRAAGERERALKEIKIPTLSEVEHLNKRDVVPKRQYAQYPLITPESCVDFLVILAVVVVFAWTFLSSVKPGPGAESAPALHVVPIVAVIVFAVSYVVFKWLFARRN